MKTVKILVLVLALAVISLAATNAVGIDDEVRQELETAYAKIDAAIKEKDVDTLASFLSEDYEKRAGDKKMNREETIAEMKKTFEMVKKIESAKTTIDKIQQVEGNYIVDYTETGKVVLVGSDTAIEATTKGRDWWVKNDDGKWHCVAAEKLD